MNVTKTNVYKYYVMTFIYEKILQTSLCKSHIIVSHHRDFQLPVLRLSPKNRKKPYL